tara:strand:+ start:84 stop:1472 length:1389 start_codon:yes stop_codon:yes gene_type:complete
MFNMAIRSINKIDYVQNLSTQSDKKSMYGEIFTPFSLIKDMFDMLPASSFTNPDAKWLDPGAGTGFFSMYLFWKLDDGLTSVIPGRTARHDHIVNKMIHMIEVQEDNVETLQHMFGEDANISCEDFTTHKGVQTFDYIIGNPPYNANGLKKVPTNGINNKKQDGHTIWIPFIKMAISLLKEYGNLLMIVPSIWMKPDKAKTYNYLLNYKINNLRCLTNTETNKVFSSEAQTPTCYFWLVNRPNDFILDLYDRDQTAFIEYPIQTHAPIPVFGAAIVAKLIPFVEEFGHIKVMKTNTPRQGAAFSQEKDKAHPFPNIKTAVLEGLSPRLVINYSNRPQTHHGECKLVLPHKMYGFPYIDMSGEFGISNRDNYVIVDRPLEELEILREFFATKTALYLFETTRYRMKYLERYAFELIPDILKMPPGLLVRPITDETIGSLFGFDSTDINNIKTLHRKEYDFTYK